MVYKDIASRLLLAVTTEPPPCKCSTRHVLEERKQRNLAFETMTGDGPDEKITIEDQSRCTFRSDEPGLVNKPRSALVDTYNGKKVGVCIFLTVSELHALGINLSQTDSDVVEYTINNETNRLVIQPRNR